MASSESASKQMSGFSIDPSILKQFHPLDLVADEYIDQLVAKATVIDIQKGEYVFKSPRSSFLSHYLLSGKVDLQYKIDDKKIDATDPDCYYPLDHKQPIETSAKALSNCQVLQLNRDFINHLISPNLSTEFGLMGVASSSDVELADDEGWLDSLLESPLLQHLSTVDICSLFTKLEHIEAREGQAISCNGPSAGYFYIIKKGYAEMCSDTGNANNITLQPGDYFCDGTMVSQTVGSASIRMTSDGVLARLALAEFNEILHAPLVCDARENEMQAHIDNVSACIILDVRLPAEFIHSHCEQSRNVPMNQLCGTLPLLDKSKLYLIVPEGERRSELATYMLRQAGFDAYLLADDQAEALDAVS